MSDETHAENENGDSLEQSNPEVSENYAFQIQDLFPDVANNYLRLREAPHVESVLETLKRWGMDDWDIEVLFRTMANLPRDWHWAHEPYKQKQERRSRLLKKLQQLDQEVATDPDLAGLSWSDGTIIYGALGAIQDGITLSDMLREAAEFIVIPDAPLRENSKSTTPDRKVSLQRYVLLQVFEFLESHLSKHSNLKRAPNKETEVLCSVLLNETIKPGTVTQLRKGVRRTYYREKE